MLSRFHEFRFVLCDYYIEADNETHTYTVFTV